MVTSETLVSEWLGAYQAGAVADEHFIGYLGC